MEDLGLPEGWISGSTLSIEKPRVLAIDSLQHANLTLYYRTDRNYAGATFAGLGDNDPDDITPSDLHTVSMLSVTVGPLGTRNLLNNKTTRNSVLKALQVVDHTVTLAEASAKDLLAAWALHEAVIAAIRIGSSGAGPWVTASKLCARKRPLLIPVRDNIVGDALGQGATGAASVYWQLMRGLLLDPVVTDAIAAARTRVSTEASTQGVDVAVDDSDLRFLDSAIWMHKARGSRADVSETEAA